MSHHLLEAVGLVQCHYLDPSVFPSTALAPPELLGVLDEKLDGDVLQGA